MAQARFPCKLGGKDTEFGVVAMGCVGEEVVGSVGIGTAGEEDGEPVPGSPVNGGQDLVGRPIMGDFAAFIGLDVLGAITGVGADVDQDKHEGGSCAKKEVTGEPLGDRDVLHGQGKPQRQGEVNGLA